MVLLSLLQSHNRCRCFVSGHLNRNATNPSPILENEPPRGREFVATLPHSCHSRPCFPFFSIMYWVIGAPPSESGGCHSSETRSASQSVTSGVCGFPGSSEWKILHYFQNNAQSCSTFFVNLYKNELNVNSCLHAIRILRFSLLVSGEWVRSALLIDRLHAELVRLTLL